MNDINKECQRLYRDIEFFRGDLFDGKLNKMCEACFCERGHVYYDEEEKDLFYRKYKKLFRKKPWDAGDANQRTLAALRELKALIGKTKQYREKLKHRSRFFSGEGK